MDDDAWARAMRLSEAQKLSVSNFVRIAVEKHCDAVEAEQNTMRGSVEELRPHKP